MDLIGEIVEHGTVTPVSENIRFNPPANQTGFPKPALKKPSRWRQRLQQKGLSSMSGAVDVASNKQKDDGKFYTTDSETNLKQFKSKNDRKLDYSGLSEVEQIHQENIEILAKMSTHEREDAKQELLDNLDPKVLQMLMKRSAKKYGPPSETAESKDPLYEPVEGSMGTWVGGEHELDKPSNVQPQRTYSNSSSLKSAMKSPSINQASTMANNKDKEAAEKKKIRFSKEAKVIYLNQKDKVSQTTSADSDPDAEWEDFQDVEESETSPSQYPKIDDDAGPSIDDALRLKQLDNEESAHSSIMHFPKPTQPYEELDINDPKFNDKLYEKYFPDLPKNPKQLEWMKSDSRSTPSDISYDSVESVRFDFKGDIITSENIDKYTNENQGLYNHSQNPELPGYTLSELAHYLRSTFPGQVCIACRTLGRILYKLGTLQYQVHEMDDENDMEGKMNESGVEGMFEIELWKLMIKLKVVELLQMYASDKEKNLSVKNYAIDALWLWKQGNGDVKIKKHSQKEETV